MSITILDENDNSPVFDITSDTSVDIAENTPMREKVAVVLGRDRDAGLNGLVRINKEGGAEPAEPRRVSHFFFPLIINSMTFILKTRSYSWLTPTDKHNLLCLRNCIFSPCCT